MCFILWKYLNVSVYISIVLQFGLRYHFSAAALPVGFGAEA